jgi:hypothetical protein
MIRIQWTEEAEGKFQTEGKAYNPLAGTTGICCFHHSLESLGGTDQAT